MSGVARAWFASEPSLIARPAWASSCRVEGSQGLGNGCRLRRHELGDSAARVTDNTFVCLRSRGQEGLTSSVQLRKSSRRFLNFQNGARRTGTHGHTPHVTHTPHTATWETSQVPSLTNRRADSGARVVGYTCTKSRKRRGPSYTIHSTALSASAGVGFRKGFSSKRRALSQRRAGGVVAFHRFCAGGSRQCIQRQPID